MTTAREAKLYYFNPNSYSTEWFVAAYSREEAIEAVKRYIRTEGYAASIRIWDSPIERQAGIEEELLDLERYINEVKTHWDDKAPCIEEHPIGKVIQTEIS